MIKGLKNLLTKIHRDERGAMSVEMMLIIAIVALPIIIALFIFRHTIVGWFDSNANQLNNN